MSETSSQRKPSVIFTDSSTEGSVTAPKILAPKTMGTVGRRKMSFAKLAVNATEKLTSRRMTMSRALLAGLPETKSDDKPLVKLENTYKMIPDEGTRFSSVKAKAEIKDIFDHYLEDMKYDPGKCAKLCCDLAVLMKNRIKSLDCQRYKIICNVIIGQCNDQGLETASRALWDSKNDNCASLTYRNSSLFAVGIVHAVYFE